MSLYYGRNVQTLSFFVKRPQPFAFPLVFEPDYLSALYSVLLYANDFFKFLLFLLFLCSEVQRFYIQLEHGVWTIGFHEGDVIGSVNDPNIQPIIYVGISSAAKSSWVFFWPGFGKENEILNDNFFFRNRDCI